MTLLSQFHENVSRAYTMYQVRSGAMPSDEAVRRRDEITCDANLLRQHQIDCLAALIHHARTTVPWYEDLPVAAIDDVVAYLKNAPILEKKTIREHGGSLLSTAVNPADRYSNASGGSTGTPLQFVQDRRYAQMGRLATVQYDRWTGWQRGEPVALLWGAPTDIARYGRLRERLRNFLQNRSLLDAFNFSDQKLCRAVQVIEAKQPALIVAYASAAYLLAMHLQRRSMVLTAKRNRSLIASAEILWPHYRTLIEQHLNCRVYNRYGSREVGLVAMECKHGRMHINALDVIVEVDNPAEDGTGDLLVTQLHNYAFPFVRYRIGDTGAISHARCACGRATPVLSHLTGRTTDYIVTPSGERIHGEWFTHLLYGVPGIRLFTFRQSSASAYSFEIDKTESFDSHRFDEAMYAARKRLGRGATLNVHFVDRMSLAASGKHRFVVNEYNIASGVDRAGNGQEVGSAR